MALLLPGLFIWSTPFDSDICTGFENPPTLDNPHNLLRKACSWTQILAPCFSVQGHGSHYWHKNAASK